MKAKRARQFLKRNRKNFWKEAEYEVSTHPKEQLHQKLYFKDVVQYTKAGAKHIKQEVPMKVGTLRLKENCGKAIYKKLKAHNIPL